MSVTSYEYLAILQVQSDQRKSQQETGEYTAVLNDVRAMIAQDHANELAAALQSADAAETLKGLILKYAAERMAGQEYNSDALVRRIYEDMAGLGVLTEYLQDPTVEEINGNSFDVLEVIYADRVKFLRGKDAFPSPLAAQDIVKRMVRMGGMLLDAQTPKVDSFIGGGIRISASIPPLVPEDVGVVFSVRKQTKSDISREMLISSGMVSSEILDFLVLCLCNKVSVGIAGGTGSGKTTLETFLLNEYIRRNEDHNSRIYIIEDSREINLIDYDATHNRPARVIYNVANKEWPMRRLVADSLRYDPQLIVPAEVRDGAAFDAATAGQTGHTILTSFHADNAKEGYKRLKNLCVNANTGLPDSVLLEMCVDAWPVMVHLEMGKDNVRRVTEVFEATGTENGKVEGNVLWRFSMSQTDRDDNGRVTHIEGEHKPVGTLSSHLFSHILSKGGVTREYLYGLFPHSTEEVGYL